MRDDALAEGAETAVMTPSACASYKLGTAGKTVTVLYCFSRLFRKVAGQPPSAFRERSPGAR